MPPDFLISPVDINNLNSAFLEATFFYLYSLFGAI